MLKTRRTKLHPDDAKTAARLAGMSGDRPIGDGGTMPPTTDFLQWVNDHPLHELVETIEQMAADAEAVDYGNNEGGCGDVKFTGEQMAALLIFCNELDFYADKLKEHVGNVRSSVQFIYNERGAAA